MSSIPRIRTRLAIKIDTKRAVIIVKNYPFNAVWISLKFTQGDSLCLPADLPKF
jgi:hypothetical protein